MAKKKRILCSYCERTATTSATGPGIRPGQFPICDECLRELNEARRKFSAFFAGDSSVKVDDLFSTNIIDNEDERIGDE